MAAMTARRLWLVVMGLAALAAAPATAGASAASRDWTCPADRQIADRLTRSTPALCVVTDHVHREGMFLVVDAIVRNISGRPMTRAEIGVECYTYAGDQLAAEDTVLRPDRLEPGQEGTVLVVTPWQDGIEKVRYLVTWRQADHQYQGAVEREVELAGPAPSTSRSHG
jgi:hypothetical protein